MTLTPLGAAGGEVTGSAYLLETGRARVLVDFGLFQGGRALEESNRLPPLVRPDRLDAVLVTHAHLDHTGRLPLLSRAGYAGPVYATPATIELAGLVLRDSAKLQAQDIERTNRRRSRAGEEPVEAPYTLEHVAALLGLLRPVPYHEPVTVAPGVTARWFEAGHMLGSASIHVRVETPDGTARTIEFSGDLGPVTAPILREFEAAPRSDVVVLESTYGDRDHRPLAETVREFTGILQRAVAEKGKILVPTFAIGRAQLLILLLAELFRRKAVAPFPIFLDSPMAIEATAIYQRHPELYDEEMRAFIRERSVREELHTLQPCPTAEDSRRINDLPGPLLVLAGNGMCSGGRIVHHLRHNLGRPGTHVLIVGFQARGSLGRRLVERDPQVRVLGDEITVRAQVHTLGGFSAHAGQTDLLKWFAHLAASQPRVLLTHGEDGPRRALAARLGELHGVRVELPELAEPFTV
ncbi:MAG: MBL fold metallo-hydrolase RNA specificity domain-containing protein [Limisphaerales bacterium]